MKVVIIGAGFGGLAAGLRLSGTGCEVTVLEQGPRPGGRASQIEDAGFTWDTGPSLITMPWVLKQTFAAGGLDLHSEVTLRRLSPLYRIHWSGEERTFDFFDSPARLKEEVARFSPSDAERVEAFLAALKPIYEKGILAAGQRAFGDPRSFVALVPVMARLRAIESLHRFVARYFTHPRVREAFSFHSLFIGGDPYRVPAIYGALVYLQVLDGGWYADGGVYSLVEAMSRPLDVRCDAQVARIETASGRVTGVRLATGERIQADAVVSNADVLSTRALLGMAPARRRLRPTMSCFLLYLGTDRTYESLRHHTLLVGPRYREFIRCVTRGRELPPTFSTYVHAPARTEPGMATPGGDSLAILLPVPNLRARVDWERESDNVRDALIGDLEESFGLTGLNDSIQVEHRMTPLDFQSRFGAVSGNAFAIEPTLQQSAYFRPHNRVPGLTGMYLVGGGTHPGAGIPGVLMGAAVTAGLVAEDARVGGAGAAVSVRAGLVARGPHRGLRSRQAAPDARTEYAAQARETTHRRASTFALACRLLPREIRSDVYLLYMVFRALDDLVDEHLPEAAARVEAVSAWAQGHAFDRTQEVRLLDELAARHPIPREAITDFCEGMRQDLRREALATEDDVDRYAYRVAGTVGIVMSAILGTDGDSPTAARAAAALGMAMQRTNILRDIDEDAAVGRVYFAQETVDRYGSPAPGARAPLMRDQIARADALYDEGLAGLSALRHGRHAIAAAAAMYREILRELERRGLGTEPGRAVVSTPRKLAVGLRAIRNAPSRRSQEGTLGQRRDDPRLIDGAARIGHEAGKSIPG